MTITLGDGPTHPTPSRPKPGPPPPDPPRKPVDPPPAIVERGQDVIHNAQVWRVDGHLLPHAVCRLCTTTHAVDYVLGSPGRGMQLGRVAGCEVRAAS